MEKFMTKTVKTKVVKLKPFQKVLQVLISGNPVTKEELDTLLGKQIQMYRISTYMWHIKTHANGVIRVVKDGRKVSGYQLVNTTEVKEYMKRAGITGVAAPVAKLADLKAEELTDAQVEDIVTKAEASEMTVTEVTQ
jgi:hypothetical protein